MAPFAPLWLEWRRGGWSSITSRRSSPSSSPPTWPSCSPSSSWCSWTSLCPSRPRAPCASTCSTLWECLLLLISFDFFFIIDFYCYWFLLLLISFVIDFLLLLISFVIDVYCYWCLLLLIFFCYWFLLLLISFAIDFFCYWFLLISFLLLISFYYWFLLLLIYFYYWIFFYIDFYWFFFIIDFYWFLLLSSCFIFPSALPIYMFASSKLVAFHPSCRIYLLIIIWWSGVFGYNLNIIWWYNLDSFPNAMRVFFLRCLPFPSHLKPPKEICCNAIPGLCHPICWPVAGKNIRKDKFSLFFADTRGIQKVLRQILKNTLFMKFTKLFFYIVSIQFITLL